MSARLDTTLRRYPEHEEGIRALASRDPSGNLKYLDWSAKMLSSGQALAPEIGDIVEMFHAFAGSVVGHGPRHMYRRTRVRDRIHTDIHAYHPKDLAKLSGLLRKAKKARDAKRKKRERLYRIEGSVDAAVIYDSDDLIVRHIRNKQASAHYGRSTKWCIAMTREGYFEDYDTHNACFFFFERKAPVKDEFDKVALLVPRTSGGSAEAFTALDRRVDMVGLARIFGDRIFDIFRTIFLVSQTYPGSDMARVYAGTATSEQVVSVFARVKEIRGTHPRRSLLEAICCNDAAPLALLETVRKRGAAICGANRRRSGRRRLHFRRYGDFLADFERSVEAALFLHPSLPDAMREAIGKSLRKRHIKLDAIRRVSSHGGGVHVEFGSGPTMHVYHRRRVRTPTVQQLLSRASWYERMAERQRKRAARLAAMVKRQAASEKPRRSP